MDQSELPESTEVLVVGGGPGGYVSAIRAAQRGLDVTLVEAAALGGVCLNHGCIPSKALLTATDRVTAATDSEHMGIYAEPYVDPGELAGWTDGVVDRLAGGVERRCDATGVRVVAGRAAFGGPHTARVDGTPGGRVEFDHAVVATGSRPVTLPGFDPDSDPVMDSREALALETVPDRLVVVGAGYIGMELSTVYARLGTDVTVVEALDSVLPGFPRPLSEPVRHRARERGITFHLESTAEAWQATADGVTVDVAGPDGARTAVAGDRILVAVGREPVTETVEPAAAGVSTTDEGFIATDERCRTECSHVYAVGDVAGEPLLAHKASMEGVVAAETIAGRDVTTQDRPIPAVVFTDPQIATVGRTATAAERDGQDVVTGSCPFAANGRALTADAADGYLKLVADADTGRLLGSQVVGDDAAELVGELSLSIAEQHTLADLAAVVHVHPTLAEAITEAADQARGHAIHAP